MTVSEKYCEMNNAFCKLRDAIYNPNVEDEKDESPSIQASVETALGVINYYLDFYKKTNEVKSHINETK